MQQDDAYLIEFYRLSNFVKATAVDPVTGKEAVCVFPSRGVTDHYMKSQAVRLLQRKIHEHGANITDTDKIPTENSTSNHIKPGGNGLVV